MKATKTWCLAAYMAKNLYWIQCTNKSQFNRESRYRPADTDLQFISLIPTGFDKDSNKYLKNNTITHDPAYFWQLPEVKKISNMIHKGDELLNQSPTKKGKDLKILPLFYSFN